MDPGSCRSVGDVVDYFYLLSFITKMAPSLGPFSYRSFMISEKPIRLIAHAMISRTNSPSRTIYAALMRLDFFKSSMAATSAADAPSRRPSSVTSIP